jgi:hypothetical protein
MNARLYGLYLEEKVAAYREVGEDHAKKPMDGNSELRTMLVDDTLFAHTTAISLQIQALIQCKVTFLRGAFGELHSHLALAHFLGNNQQQCLRVVPLYD